MARESLAVDGSNQGQTTPDRADNTGNEMSGHVVGMLANRF